MNTARHSRNQKNIHHRAFRLGGPVWWGKKLGCVGRFFGSGVGYANSFVSNSHKFCFLGATETLRKTKSKAKREHTEVAEATEAQGSQGIGSSWLLRNKIYD